MALELVTGDYLNYLLESGWHIEQNGRLVPPDMVIEGQYQVMPKNEVCILELIRLHQQSIADEELQAIGHVA